MKHCLLAEAGARTGPNWARTLAGLRSLSALARPADLHVVNAAQDINLQDPPSHAETIAHSSLFTTGWRLPRHSSSAQRGPTLLHQRVHLVPGQEARRSTSSGVASIAMVATARRCSTSAVSSRRRCTSVSASRRDFWIALTPGCDPCDPDTDWLSNQF